ncbi:MULTISPECIES: carbohydrate ABC transporter permease [unclassified Microbacterium]|uniref:carbohydrate ABC transporter permease n=1 Tax=unclassified Microbacterium TaxID=2609290 RepID=UPI002468FD93|nr:MULTISPECIES: carbohydrate ABC transporter permease [unclassified Microbacterium]MDH5131692.1 carbohydrate ABC transporter permease [Microbacterium sp. RD10]MDH5138381.1 carbohydrate ABC transporter permease [Microbacterium sp. RD11]MDH5144185.1 carbohydrate ABC transporter permease [Microbacterium sp. RD12]MDH5153788.1 carbohydrate ABC transporter permease [Microbacterium sp. RD06]MDH5167609.1 carbohydrate ABC transporter permease [Microbacterium sp. RD02]
MTTTRLVTVTPPTKRRSRRPQAADAPPPSIAPGPAARTFGIIALVVATLYFLVPVFWLVVASTKNNTDLTSTFGFWFAEPNLAANYDSLMGWTQGLFWRWVGNSLFYSLSAGIIGTLFAVMAGYAIAKFAFPGKKLAVGIIMAGLLLPVALLTVPLCIEFQALGLTNTVWAIIIPSAVSPFGVFLGMVYAQSSVPTELLEAARIDGAGEARIFFTIVLRLLGPAMVTIFLFIFVATWNNFLLPLMMISSPDLKPVTLGLYGMMSYFSPDKGAVMLGALLGVIPLIALFFTLQKYWRSGLAAGAVKG